MSANSLTVVPFLVVLLMTTGVSYLVIALLLRHLRSERPDIFETLGSPRFSELVTRNPVNFRISWRFLMYVIAGRGIAETSGLLRILFAANWVCSVITIVALLSILILAMLGHN
jgi:hypothetical protein